MDYSNDSNYIRVYNYKTILKNFIRMRSMKEQVLDLQLHRKLYINKVVRYGLQAKTVRVQHSISQYRLKIKHNNFRYNRCIPIKNVILFYFN